MGRRTAATLAALALWPGLAAGQAAPCVSEPAYTLADGAPFEVERSSMAGDPSKGEDRVLLEHVELPGGPTLRIEGRSCTWYVVDYLVPAAGSGTSVAVAVLELARALRAVEPFDRSPVPLEQIAGVLETTGLAPLLEDAVVLSDNELGEFLYVRVEEESGGRWLRASYVRGL